MVGLICRLLIVHFFGPSVYSRALYKREQAGFRNWNPACSFPSYFCCKHA